MPGPRQSLLRQEVVCVDCCCSCLAGRRHRCESCASWRSTPFTCFATLGPCRCLNSESWPHCPLPYHAPMRFSITRTLASRSIAKRFDCWKKPESARQWSNTGEDSGTWRADGRCPAEIAVNFKKQVCIVKPWSDFHLEW